MTKPLEANFARVSVWDANGKQVDAGDAQVSPEDPKVLSVGLLTLPPGRYTIKFRLLSVDGHVVENEFPFTIRGKPIPSGTPKASPQPSGTTQ
jgi:methionine-rich copper-binding protein CopC